MKSNNTEGKTNVEITETTEFFKENEANNMRPEQIEGDADTVVSEITMMTTMEEVEHYRDGKLAAYRAAFDNNQIPYDMTANKCVMYQLDGVYQIFDRDYGYEQVAYSLYDYHQQEIESGISFEYDFHPEKGLSVDDPYVKMLYDFIQTTGEEFLLEKITSHEALVAEIERLEPGVWLCATDKCKLMVEKKSASVYCLQFAHVERIYTNVVVEPVYREFATYAEYEDFCNDVNAFHLVEKVIANPAYKIWDGDGVEELFIGDRYDEGMQQPDRIYNILSLNNGKIKDLNGNYIYGRTGMFILFDNGYLFEGMDDGSQIGLYVNLLTGKFYEGEIDDETYSYIFSGTEVPMIWYKATPENINAVLGGR